MLAVFLASFGCGRQRGYLVVSSNQVTEKDPNSYSGSVRNVLILTLEHRGVIIKAHCQAFDTINHCGELRVGEPYDLERDDQLRYLTLRRDGNDSWAVLGIDEEHMR
jgi:hypothetical protein